MSAWDWSLIQTGFYLMKIVKEEHRRYMEAKPWPYTQELVSSFWPCSNWELSTYTTDRNSTKLNYTSSQEAIIWPKIKNSFGVVKQGGTWECKLQVHSQKVTTEKQWYVPLVWQNDLIMRSCLLRKKNCISVNSYHYFTDKILCKQAALLTDFWHHFPFHELSISYIIK